MNALLNTLNEVEEGLHAIRITEDYLLIQKESELSESRREQLKKNMNLINESLKKNKQRLAELQEKLNGSSINLSVLQKSIDRLTKEMNDKGELVVKLQSDLERKDVQIEELSLQIDELHADVKELEEVSLLQVDKINEQEQELNTVYYCFGTKKELKEQNILTGGGLFSKTKALQSDFNMDYFQAVDKREVTSIPLYSSKATIKSNHPAGSYRFVKDKDGKLMLEIDQPAIFWNTSQFLVIEIR
jgi:uncharacterized protein (DUF3084 family)